MGLGASSLVVTSRLNIRVFTLRDLKVEDDRACDGCCRVLREGNFKEVESFECFVAPGLIDNLIIRVEV